MFVSLQYSQILHTQLAKKYHSIYEMTQYLYKLIA